LILKAENESPPPRSLSAARGHLKEDKITLPSNHHLYDLLAQAEVVEADENGQCVKRIRVPGKRGPVELYALLFATNTIIPQAILPMLPTFTFEVVAEELTQAGALVHTGDEPRQSQDSRSVRWGQSPDRKDGGHKRRKSPASGGRWPAAGAE
jgi:hypothetical protein